MNKLFVVAIMLSMLSGCQFANYNYEVSHSTIDEVGPFHKSPQTGMDPQSPQ